MTTIIPADIEWVQEDDITIVATLGLGYQADITTMDDDPDDIRYEVVISYGYRDSDAGMVTDTIDLGFFRDINIAKVVVESWLKDEERKYEEALAAVEARMTEQYQAERATIQAEQDEDYRLEQKMEAEDALAQAFDTFLDRVTRVVTTKPEDRHYEWNTARIEAQNALQDFVKTVIRLST